MDYIITTLASDISASERQFLAIAVLKERSGLHLVALEQTTVTDLQHSWKSPNWISNVLGWFMHDKFTYISDSLFSRMASIDPLAIDYPDYHGENCLNATLPCSGFGSCVVSANANNQYVCSCESFRNPLTNCSTTFFQDYNGRATPVVSVRCPLWGFFLEVSLVWPKFIPFHEGSACAESHHNDPRRHGDLHWYPSVRWPCLQDAPMVLQTHPLHLLH